MTLSRKHTLYQRTILIVMGAFAALILALRVSLVFSHVTDTGGMSVNILYSIRHLAETGVLYVNPEEPPFSITQYMPLHYYIIAWAGRLAGVQHDVYALSVINRMFCLLIGIAYSIVTGRAIRKLFPQAGMFVAVIAAILSFVVIPGINYSRLDNLYLLFNTVALVYFIRSIRSEGAERLKVLTYAGLCLAAALLTKQTAIITVGLMGLWLLFAERDIKGAVRFTLAIAVPFVLLLICMVPEPFSVFKLNVVDGLKNGIKLSWFYFVIAKYYYLRFGIYIAFGVYLAVWILPSFNDKTGRFLAWSILYFLATATFLCLKAGSGPNYYLEFTTALLLGVGYMAHQRPGEYNHFLPFFICWLPFFIFPYLNDKGWHNIQQDRSTNANYANCAAVAEYVDARIAPNKFVLTNFHRENSLNLMLCKTALFPTREVALTYTRPQGVFTFNKFFTLMKEGDVQYYIDLNGKRPDAFIDAPLERFVQDTVIGAYTVYRFQ